MHYQFLLQATSTAWIFLLTNIGLEISSGIFDQFSSPSNPHSALIIMLLAIVAVIISIWELIHKGIKEKVKYRRRLGIFGWFYSRSGDNRIFGSVPDICALLGGISQWVYSTVQYVCTLRHVENPYKIYLWPIIFLLCLGASRLHWNHRNMTTKLKQQIALQSLYDRTPLGLVVDLAGIYLVFAAMLKHNMFLHIITLA